MPRYPSSQWDPGPSTNLGPSASFIGIVTVANALNAGNVTLNPSPNFVGLMTVVNTDPLLRAGEDLTNDVQKVENRYSYQALTSLVTLNVKSGAGFLHTLTIGNQSAPTVELYDSLTATGTLIARINAASAPQTYTFDVSFSTGLTLNPQPGTAVLPNLTVSYR